MDVLADTLLGNPVERWLLAAVVVVLAYATLWLVAGALVAKLKRVARRTRARWDDVVTHALHDTKRLVVLIVATFAGSRTVVLPDEIDTALQTLAMIALLVQAGLWVSAGMTRWVDLQRDERSGGDAASVMTMNVVGVLARTALWSLVLLLALDNLGVDVTALVAGLGIGGVAVALAAQNILGDLFASLSIVIDRPFVRGDALAVGEFLGRVEQIGLKTTRVRSLSGEQLVFSNADLLSSRIRNYGRMHERRVLFEIGVAYHTDRTKLETIPHLIREAIERQGRVVRFERSHFKTYGDLALVFETVYYVLTADYNTYMDAQQAVNLRIHERFETEGIDFAIPVQSLVVHHPTHPMVARTERLGGHR